jgi:hypothetical protein
VNKSLSVDVQNIQVIKNEGNSNSQKTLYSIHYPMLYQDLIRYNSNKVYIIFFITYFLTRDGLINLMVLFYLLILLNKI